jgi:hypothetical protein
LTLLAFEGFGLLRGSDEHLLLFIERGPLREGRAIRPMRGRIATCLLCLMILCSSVDTLPDPPALKPPKNQSSLICQLEHHVVTPAGNHALSCRPWIFRFQARSSSFEQSFRKVGPSYGRSFVRQATDSSPPRFS